MRVKVLLFARLREVAGQSAWECDVPAESTVADVWRVVTRKYAALEAFGSGISPAVNAEFARMTADVHEGDEIAFLPPVSGG